MMAEGLETHCCARTSAEVVGVECLVLMSDVDDFTSGSMVNVSPCLLAALTKSPMPRIK